MLADGNEAMESDISEEEDASLPCKYVEFLITFGKLQTFASDISVMQEGQLTCTFHCVILIADSL